MFVRKTGVKRNGKTYEYMQLVESVRRKSDGRPVHKVLQSLGLFDPVLFHNLNLAFSESRKGIRIPVVTKKQDKFFIPRPVANLRYLEVAVVDALWREWGLDRVFRDLMHAGKSEVDGSLVVEALVAQRLVAPDSKLAAVRWFSTTALPEMMGIGPGQFNNTRVHRVLDELDANTPSLMAWLPVMYQKRDKGFVSLFLDVTDTWFVGHGPKMAARGKTKEGMTQRKIGIVILCNERGYPVRWDVIPGNRGDGRVMLDMMKGIEGLKWVGNAPVVMDRAMGDSTHISELVSTNIRFLTALRRPEFSKYAKALPWEAMAGISVEGRSGADLVREAAEKAISAGMKKVDDTMFVKDMGVPTIGTLKMDAMDSCDKERDLNAWALRKARQVVQDVADGRHNSFAAAGDALGVKSSVLKKYRKLLGLSWEIQARVLNGDSIGIPLTRLVQIVELKDPEAQMAEFDKQFEIYRSGLSTKALPKRLVGAAIASESKTFKVRVVAFFNPEQFVDQRRNSMEKLTRIQDFVTGLNQKQASAKNRRTPKAILGEIDRRLHHDNMVEIFDVSVIQEDFNKRTHNRINLTLDRDRWEKRIRYHGFSVLVGHDKLTQSAEEICRLYRSRDMAEKDFQVIKSVVELRPVRRHTDLKVRAHVTLCMLALLVERTLREKLSGTCSPERALETLETCHLNLYKIEDSPNIYSITEPNPEQKKLLKKLHLSHLVDDSILAQHILPR